MKEITINNLKKSNNLLCIIPYESINIHEQLKELYQDIFIGYQNEIEENNIKEENKIYIKPILCINENDNIYLKYLESIKKGIPVNEIQTIYNNHIIKEEKV